jgi:hypothetical protein
MDVNGIVQHFIEIKDGSEVRGYHDPLFHPLFHHASGALDQCSS